MLLNQCLKTSLSVYAVSVTLSTLEAHHNVLHYNLIYRGWGHGSLNSCIETKLVVTLSHYRAVCGMAQGQGCNEFLVGAGVVRSIILLKERMMSLLINPFCESVVEPVYNMPHYNLNSDITLIPNKLA